MVECEDGYEGGKAHSASMEEGWLDNIHELGVAFVHRKERTLERGQRSPPILYSC